MNKNLKNSSAIGTFEGTYTNLKYTDYYSSNKIGDSVV